MLLTLMPGTSFSMQSISLYARHSHGLLPGISIRMLSSNGHAVIERFEIRMPFAEAFLHFKAEQQKETDEPNVPLILCFTR